jgi:DNA-directed RNA polymerase subunit RPC12/RpoP
MDVAFICPNCKQELEADASLAGTTIQCPSCNHALTIPEPDVQNVKIMNPIASSAAAREENTSVCPVHEGPSEILIKNRSKRGDSRRRKAAPAHQDHPPGRLHRGGPRPL